MHISIQLLFVYKGELEIMFGLKPIEGSRVVRYGPGCGFAFWWMILNMLGAALGASIMKFILPYIADKTVGMILSAIVIGATMSIMEWRLLIKPYLRYITWWGWTLCGIIS